MSGASIPYHLRPHKAVDRRIFVDLLGRLERWRPIVDYVYVSMGAYPLEDHKLIHRIIGITRQIAFDMEPKVVARQKFNRPLDTCHCVERTSEAVVDNFDALLKECGFPDPSGVVVWLDYTAPKMIGEQIREFQTLIDKLSVGDIVRITVNAHPNDQACDTPASSKPLLIEEKKEKQFQKLQRRIGDYLPSWAGTSDMTAEGLPRVLAESFSAAVLKAFPTTNSNTFSPLSIIRYADGQQMLSITGVIVERTREAEMKEAIHLQTWPFASTTWSTIHRLVVPDLTLRERLHLERQMVTKSGSESDYGLGFDVASKIKIVDFIESYKNYYRFYPTLLGVEL